jgi:hypothetical protein
MGHSIAPPLGVSSKAQILPEAGRSFSIGPRRESPLSLSTTDMPLRKAWASQIVIARLRLNCCSYVLMHYQPCQKISVEKA